MATTILLHNNCSLKWPEEKRHQAILLHCFFSISQEDKEECKMEALKS